MCETLYKSILMLTIWVQEIKWDGFKEENLWLSNVPNTSWFYCLCTLRFNMVFSMVQRTHLPMQETQATRVRSLDWEDLLEEGMATHSSILAWRIPWTEEPGSLQSMGSHRIGHYWSDLVHTHIWFIVQRMKIVIWITSACTPSFLHSWTPVSREQQRPLFFSLVPTS